MIKQILCLMAITPLMAATPDGDGSANASAATAAGVTEPFDLTGGGAATAAALADPTQKKTAIDKIIHLGFNLLVNRTISNKDLATKVGITEIQLVGYQEHIKTLLKRMANKSIDYDKAEAFAKELLGVCLKAQTKKLNDRLVAAGVDKEAISLFQTLGYVVTQGVAKVASTGVCGSCFAKSAQNFAEAYELAVPQSE